MELSKDSHDLPEAPTTIEFPAEPLPENTTMTEIPATAGVLQVIEASPTPNPDIPKAISLAATETARTHAELVVQGEARARESWERATLGGLGQEQGTEEMESPRKKRMRRAIQTTWLDQDKSGDYVEGGEAQLGEAADLGGEEHQPATSSEPAGPKVNSKANTPVTPTKPKVIGPAVRKPQQKTMKRQEKAPKGRQSSNGQAEEVDLAALGYSDQVLQRMAAKLPREVGIILAEKASSAQGAPNPASMEEFISGNAASKKRKRPTIEDAKKKVPDQDRDVPIDQRKTDSELITIALTKTRAARYLAAPYCFNRRGMLYKEYWRLGDLKDSNGNAYLDDELLNKLIDNLEWQKKRSENPGLFGGKGVRIRKAKQTDDRHDLSTGKFKKALESEGGRKLAGLTKQELIHQSLRLNDTVEPGSLAKVKRMKKQRRESEALIESSMARFVAATKLEHETAVAWNAANAALIERNTQLQQLSTRAVEETDAATVFIGQQQARIEELNEEVQRLRNQLGLANRIGAPNVSAEVVPVDVQAPAAAVRQEDEDEAPKEVSGHGEEGKETG